jgi:hypothetical protein
MTGENRFLARLAAIFLVLMVWVASPAWAQTPAPAPPAATTQAEFLGASFAQSFQGREVWITKFDGSRQRAHVGTVVPAGLTLTSKDGQGQTIRFGEIARIEKVTHRMRNHVIAGLIIGGGFGLLGSIACDGDAACHTLVPTIYAGLGMGIGALNGAARNSMNKDDDLIYQASPRTSTVMSVTPILSRTRKGVALSVTWR